MQLTDRDINTLKNIIETVKKKTIMNSQEELQTELFPKQIFRRMNTRLNFWKDY